MAARSIRKAKYKFKWTKELSFLIAGIVVLIVATILLSLPTRTDRLINKWSAASLTDETVFSEVTESNLVNRVNSGDYIFVFYATPSDSNAATNMSLIETYASTYEVDSVLWLDSTGIFEADEDTLGSRDFKDELESREDALKGVDLLETMSFWVFNGGNLVLDYADYSDSTESNTFEQMLNQAFGAWKAQQN